MNVLQCTYLWTSDTFSSLKIWHYIMIVFFFIYVHICYCLFGFKQTMHLLRRNQLIMSSIMLDVLCRLMFVSLSICMTEIWALIHKVFELKTEKQTASMLAVIHQAIVGQMNWFIYFLPIRVKLNNICFD